MSEAGGAGGAGGVGGNGGTGGVGGSDGANGSDNDSGTTGDSLGGGPNSAESSVGLGPNDSATASAPTAADNAAASAALGMAATAAPTGIPGMVSQALDGLASAVDGFSAALGKMGGFAPPGISAAIGFAQDAIGLAKSVMDGFQTGNWGGVTDSFMDMASNFTDKLSAAKEAIDAIRQGDLDSALDAAAKISKTAEKLNDMVDFARSVQSSANTGNWGGTLQAARAF